MKLFAAASTLLFVVAANATAVSVPGATRLPHVCSTRPKQIAELAYLGAREVGGVTPLEKVGFPPALSDMLCSDCTIAINRKPPGLSANCTWYAPVAQTK